MDFNFNTKTSLNVLTNVVRTLIMTLVGIFLVPYYISTLGIAAYALVPLATTLASYIQVLSDSVATATVRYSTLALEENDRDEANITLSSSFFGLGKLCLFLLPIGMVLAVISPIVFNIGEMASVEIQLLFALIILSSLIVTVSSPFNGVFYASNSLYLMYFAKLGYTISQVCAIIILFTLTTPSLIEIGIAYLISSLVMFAMVVLLSKKVDSNLAIRRNYYDREHFLKISNLGLWSIIQKVGGLLYIELSLVLVNLYLGPELQGGFAMIATIISMVNTAVYTVSDSVDPFIYRAYAEKNEGFLKEITRVSTKFITLVIVFPVTFIIVFSPEFFGAWVGSEFSYLSDALVLGLLGNLSFCSIASMMAIPRVYLKVERIAIVTVLIGIMNAVLFIAFFTFGFDSLEMALGILAACNIVLSLITAVYDAKLINARFYEFLIPMLEGYIVAAILYPILGLIHDSLSIPSQWIPLLLSLLVLFVIYFFIVYFLAFSRCEKEQIEQLVPAKISKYLPSFSIR